MTLIKLYFHMCLMCVRLDQQREEEEEGVVGVVVFSCSSSHVVRSDLGDNTSARRLDAQTLS